MNSLEPDMVLYRLNWDNPLFPIFKYVDDYPPIEIAFYPELDLLGMPKNHLERHALRILADVLSEYDAVRNFEKFCHDFNFLMRDFAVVISAKDIEIWFKEHGIQASRNVRNKLPQSQIIPSQESRTDERKESDQEGH